MPRFLWSPPETPPAPDQLPPKAWHRLKGVVLYTDGDGNYIVTGDPVEGEDHSCDEMGCSSAEPHVLLRLRRRGP